MQSVAETSQAVSASPYVSPALRRDAVQSSGRDEMLLRAVAMIGDVLDADTVILKCRSSDGDEEVYQFGVHAVLIASDEVFVDLMRGLAAPRLFVDGLEASESREVVGSLMLTPIDATKDERIADLAVASTRRGRFDAGNLLQLGVLGDLIRDHIMEVRRSAQAIGAESRDANVLLRMAFDAIAEVVIILDADGRLATCNRRAEVLLGATRESLLGTFMLKPMRTYLDTLGNPVPAESMPGMRAMKSKVSVRNFRLRSQAADGEWVWHSVSADPVLGPHGEVQFVVITARNVSEQKLAEDRLIGVADTMRRASASLNAVAEAILIFDANGILVQHNPTAARILGDNVLAGIGDHYTNLTPYFFGPEGLPFPTDELPINKALRHGITSLGVEGCIRRKGHSDMWLSINTTPVRDPVHGRIQYAVVTFHDVTTERIARDEQRRALLAARQANQAKADFLAIMSHELRTPMNAILGAVQILDNDKLDEDQRRFLGIVKDSGRQMLVLLSDLLEMASLENDRVQNRPTPSRIDEVVADAALIWEKQAHARGLTLSWSCAPEAAEPRAFDPDRARQILGNLVSNAIKFTARGGIHIHADVIETGGSDDHVRVCVRDTGEGIAAADIERVFEPFEQVDASTRRRQGGMGIGLHVARKLARAMGGDLTLESKPGAGSLFILCVPAAKAVADTPPPPAVDVESGSNVILCVDDNPRNLLVITRLLEAAGHTVVACESGRAALVAARERAFDLVLLDMVMPEMDGLDVLAHLRSTHGPNQATPVVACTANVLPEQLQAYLAAGVASVVAKPIDVQRLLAAVRASALSPAARA